MLIPVIPTLDTLCKHKNLHLLTLQALIVASKYIQLLKDDILAAQDWSEHIRLCKEESSAPQQLPEPVKELIAGALGLKSKDMDVFWDILSEFLWEPLVDDLPCNGTDFLAFKLHGWGQRLTAFLLYPPSHFCTNTRCDYWRPLKREIRKFCVVYARANSVQLGHHVHLYCHRCNTSYHNNYSVQDNKRTYYAGVPQYLQVAQHHFVERELATIWRQELVSFDNSDIKVNFTASLSAEHVWDAFTILSLLEDWMRQEKLLIVPASGDQLQRFVKPMGIRNDNMILYGQPDAVDHICDKCARFFEMPNGEIRYTQAVVADSLSMGRPCCGFFGCPDPLASTCNRFCPKHAYLNNICSVKGCSNAIATKTAQNPKTGKYNTVKYKVCSLPLHKAIEDKANKCGSACFLLKDCFQRARAVYSSKKVSPGTSSAMELPPEIGVEIPEDVETFVATGPVTVLLVSQPNPGTVGAEIEDSDPCYGTLPVSAVAMPINATNVGALPMLVDVETTSSPMLVDGSAPAIVSTSKPVPIATIPAAPLTLEDCPSKSNTGNAAFKAQLNRTRSHNEQLQLRPCGMGLAWATMFRAEAISNHLQMTKNMFSVPGS